MDLHLASSKPQQLAIAMQIGLSVPEYSITNDLKEVREFCRRNSEDIVKSIRTGFVVYGRHMLKTYTRRLDSDLAELASALRLGPAIFQKEIHRRQEWRVTVVDSQGFPCSINCERLPKNIIDIRQIDFAKERWRFNSAAVPPELVANSIRIAKAMRLHFAGVDWVEDFDGGLHFLEINPVPSFKWYEMMGAGNISAALADALSRRSAGLGTFTQF